MKKDSEFYENSRARRIWYWLTCWRPVSKSEFLHLQQNLVVILDGMRESDLQHYKTEKFTMEEIRKLKESGTTQSSNREKANDDKMFS